MCELWGDEKLAGVCREVAFEYVPVKRADRLVRVPIVKSVTSADLIESTDAKRQIYREKQDEMKKEEDCRKANALDSSNIRSHIS